MNPKLKATLKFKIKRLNIINKETIEEVSNWRAADKNETVLEVSVVVVEIIEELFLDICVL